MNKFTILSDNILLEKNIADLLNRHNKLRVVHTGHSIACSPVEYIIEPRIFKNQIIVAGCIGINKAIGGVSYLKHLCVHDQFRGLGIASKLVKAALKKEMSSKFIFMDIRSDNFPSLSLAEKEGFLIVHCKHLTNYNILTVGKTNDNT